MPDFKRSLIGYDAESVDKLMQEREARFRVEVQDLNRELAAETHQLELLRVEIERLKGESRQRLQLQDEISLELLKVYMSSVAQTAQDVQAAEREQRRVLDKMGERQSELEALKNEIKSMHNDFQAIANRYKKILD